MKHRFIYIFLAVIVFVTSLAGCTKVNEEIPDVTEAVTEEEPQPYPVTIGSLVFNSPPESVASLSPAVTEIIAELGFEDKLTGRSIYCDYPESTADIRELGSAADPDVAAIKEAAPQLLISHSPIAKKDITEIESAGTRVLIISAPSSVEELYGLYENIYRLFNGADGGEEAAVSKCFEPLENAFEEYAGMLGSYVYVMSRDLAVASDSTFAGDFLSRFGTNAAAEESGNAVTKERLLELDPEYIILSRSVKKSRLPEGLTATEEGKVLRFDSETEALLERPTSRISLAAEQLAKNIKEAADKADESAETASENAETAAAE